MELSDIYKQLAQFGNELLYKRSLEDGLPLIAQKAKEIIGANRCSVFVYDEKHQQLRTTLADGVEKIILPSDKGIAGETLQKQKVLRVNDLNKDKNFFAEIDKQTGYRTYNLLTAPIYSPTREIMGVLELLNKEGGFKQRDEKLITLFTHYLSGFIELNK